MDKSVQQQNNNNNKRNIEAIIFQHRNLLQKQHADYYYMLNGWVVGCVGWMMCAKEKWREKERRWMTTIVYKIIHKA